MSYEGYTQYWCKKGHHWTAESYEDIELCPVCGKKFVFSNSVDQTNGSYSNDFKERIDGYIKPKLIKTISKTCKCCGNKKILERIYKIPTRRKGD